MNLFGEVMILELYVVYVILIYQQTIGKNMLNKFLNMFLGRQNNG
jgi:hypothetical protein